jgi:hypothetical protein
MKSEAEKQAQRIINKYGWDEADRLGLLKWGGKGMKVEVRPTAKAKRLRL